MYKYNLQRDSEEGKYKDYMFKNIVKDIATPNPIDLRPQFPPIYDQKNLGACQSFAAGSIKESNDDCKYKYSELFLYYNARDDKSQDTGTSLRQVLDSGRKYGMCEDKYWKYIVGNFSLRPPTEAYDDGLLHTFKTYYRAVSIDEIIQAMAMGYKVMIGIEIYESFQSKQCMSTGIVPYPKGELLGGHALDIVYSERALTATKKVCFFKRFMNKLKGVQPSKGFFLIRNSWNESNGLPESRGHYKISFEVFNELLMDAWIVVE